MTAVHGVYGGPHTAKIEKVNLQNAMMRVYSKMPKAADEKIIAAFYKQFRDDEDYVRAVFMHAGMNLLSNLKKMDLEQKPARKLHREQNKAEVEKQAEAIVSVIKQNLIANFICPNGQTVGGNKGQYLVSMGGRFARIGKAAGRKRVGSVMSVQQIQQLYDGNQ